MAMVAEVAMAAVIMAMVAVIMVMVAAMEMVAVELALNVLLRIIY